MLSSYFISYLVMIFKVFVEALRRKLDILGRDHNHKSFLIKKILKSLNIVVSI